MSSTPASRNAFLRVASLLAAITLGFAPSHATTVRSLSVEEMTQRAGRIVLGRCTRVIETRHETLGVPILRVTVEVRRVLKGPSTKRLTFDTYDDAATGGSTFRPGEEVFLFLYPESRAGLTSAVGFGQGKFVKGRDKHGREVVSNGFRDRDLSEDELARRVEALLP